MIIRFSSSIGHCSCRLAYRRSARASLCRYYFFFQAEDGIRDYKVTGVQTCALPISFAAMGRISPNYIVQDGVIPRTELPNVMREIGRLSKEAGLRVANVFHAGDGNLHPLVLYDRRISGHEEAAEALSSKILELCIGAGGSITGEHGVGEDKKKMIAEMDREA